jgi:hypothetical protein
MEHDHRWTQRRRPDFVVGELPPVSLPPETVFPRMGQIWEAARDCDVGFEASLALPRPKFKKQRLANGCEVVMQEGGLVFQWGEDLPPFPWGTAKLAQAFSRCDTENWKLTSCRQNFVVQVDTKATG